MLSTTSPEISTPFRIPGSKAYAPMSHARFAITGHLLPVRDRCGGTDEEGRERARAAVAGTCRTILVASAISAVAVVGVVSTV